MENIYKETKFILNKYGIKANKSLGQNFLISNEAVEGIINAVNIQKNDLIIEIGPGLGTLTEKIVEKAGKILCIELDTRMVNILKDRFLLYNNIEIINEDVLKVDLKKYIIENKVNNITNVKIIGNLPYYITTPIVMKLLEEQLDIESITIMVQKEVAERLIAKPGSTLSGSISYAVSYYTEPEFVIDVNRDAFIPSPEVDSAVIKLNIRENEVVKVNNKELFFKIIKLAFMQRRKTLVNALVNGNLLNSKNDVEQMLVQLEIDTKIRGEKLTLEEFAKIENYVSNI